MLSGDDRKNRQTTMERATELARGVRRRMRDALRAEQARTPDDSRAWGKDLREKFPREEHAKWQAPADRPDPVELLKEQGKERLQDLLPLRYERMSASAFTFYRGTALIMASDLSHTPRTGITVQCCGDAHLSNFGMFNSPERHTVFDINDFDETLPGPWEWDVKRLAASVEICGRDRGFSAERTTEMVLACVRAYREAMREFAKMGNLEVWYAHVDMDALQQVLEKSQVSKSEKKTAAKAIAKAKRKDSTRALAKLTEVVDGRLRIVSDPPVVVPVRDLVNSQGRVGPEGPINVDMSKAIATILTEYRHSLPLERRHLIEQYEGVDVARKVVGVGSVGTRAWMIVMKGASNADPLVLQVKEAQESVFERFVGKSAYPEHGQRVVQGQRAMQTAGDLLLGWCRLPGEDGKHKDYYVRQLWDGKGNIDVDNLSYEGLKVHVRACGWTLAHAHARTGDRFAIASYLGKKDTFDRGIVQFASAYADQNELDYARFMEALDKGELPCNGREGAGA